MGWLVAWVTCIAATAGAQEGGAPVAPPADVAPTPAPTPSAEPAEAPVEAVEVPAEDAAEADVSAEEMKLLEEALAADAADSAEAEGNPPAESSSESVATVNTNTNPDISLILDVAGAYFRGEPMQTGGHDPAKTGFTLQQLEMSVSSNVDPYFRFNANVVFSQFGVEVEEAYVTTLDLPHSLQMRGGQMLTRFGRLNGTHPHAWEFVDQPLVNGKFFGGEGSRGVGAEVSWLSPLPWYAEVLASATDAHGACCARSFYGADDLGVETPADVLATAAVKQFFGLSGALSLLWGVSAQFGPNASGLDNRTEIYGTDLYLRWRPRDSLNRTSVTLTVEGMLRQRQVPRDSLRDLGGYAQLVWNIDPTWSVGGRYELVTGIEDDPLDPQWTDDRHRYGAAITYRPTHFSRLRLQGALDDARWLAGPVPAAFLNLEVTTGAHGAHSY